MDTRIDDGQLASVEDAAQTLCAAGGNFDIHQIIVATRLTPAIVRACLGILVRRGCLLAWPGERFAQPVARPGSSWATDLRPPMAALMGAR